ncbi:SKP1-like protein 4 [Papaver somniferum]|uniref:SKP1-like protein 4 n=1 Tax=Papaver somniferum TaxID=3469 RepID=UPI000E70433B|nr:SKP1-like protein 4 [Papaver somniferum]
MIVLKSADDKEFEVEESIVMLSETIKHMIEDDCAGDGIPLPNVTSDVLEKVIEFLKKHGPAMEYLYGPDGKIVKDEIDEEEFNKVAAKLMQFDQEFIDGLESDQVLFDLIFAANYLGIRNLMECTCQVVAGKLREMTPEQVRAYLRIENDYSPEQEAKVRADNAWAFQ